MELDMDDNYNIISNATDLVLSTLGVNLPSTDDRRDYYNYLNVVLNKIKNPNHVPQYLYDRRDYYRYQLKTMEDELEELRASLVCGDSFGDGMPHGTGNPNYVSEVHEKIIHIETDEILKYRKKVDEYQHKIDMYNHEFSENAIEQLEPFIDMIPNEKHRNIIHQFYFSRRSYGRIADKEFISEETAKDYRKKGFNTLTDILFNYAKNIHKM